MSLINSNLKGLINTPVIKTPKTDEILKNDAIQILLLKSQIKL